MLSFSLGYSFLWAPSLQPEPGYSRLFRPIRVRSPHPRSLAPLRPKSDLQPRGSLNNEILQNRSYQGSTKGRDMFGLVFCATAVLWISGQLLWTTYQHRVVPDHAEQSLHISKSLCKQEQAIAPVNHSDVWSHVLSESKTEQHRSKVVEWLRGAVKIPYVRSLTSEAGSPNKSVTFRTESYDGMEPVGVDPRWEVFKPLHIYLATAFPLVSVYHRLPTHVSCH